LIEVERSGLGIARNGGTCLVVSDMAE